MKFCGLGILLYVTNYKGKGTCKKRRSVMAGKNYQSDEQKNKQTNYTGSNQSNKETASNSKMKNSQKNSQKNNSSNSTDCY